MALDLINPESSNFLKNFPGQNAVNLDRIDSFAGPSLATHPLRSFTPVLTATTTPPTLGAGTNIAYYYKIWNHVYCFGQFKFGSGFAVGSGTYIIELPFNMDSEIGTSTSLGQCPIVGQGAVFDGSSNAGRLPVTVHHRTGNRLMFGVRLGSGVVNRDLRDSGYITWASGDGLSWNAQFKVVDT